MNHAQCRRLSTLRSLRRARRSSKTTNGKMPAACAIGSWGRNVGQGLPHLAHSEMSVARLTSQLLLDRHCSTLDRTSSRQIPLVGSRARLDFPEEFSCADFSKHV